VSSLAGQLASIVAASLAGGGFVAVVNALAKRRAVKADVTDRLTDSALKMLQAAGADANEAYREAAEARKEATEARRETTHARREMAALSLEVDALAGRIHRLLNLIHDPSMDIGRLRLLAPLPPAPTGGANGVGSRP